MKLEIKKDPQYEEAEVELRFSQEDEQIRSIIELVQQRPRCIKVRLEGTIKKIDIKKIFYFESVDEKSFIYTEKNVYPIDRKLYELETLLKETSFVRISKSCILNTDLLDSVKVLLNGKMEASLQNGEKMVINRHYVPGFKQKFGL